MPRKKIHHRPLPPWEQEKRLQGAGLSPIRPTDGPAPLPADLPSLEERVDWIERFIRNKRHYPFDMLFFVMYDIEDHKIRRHVAKYLQRNGCMRMQKSVFIGHLAQKPYQELAQTLAEINSMYQNGDSILVLPVTQESIARLQVIGKEVAYQMVADPPKLVII